MLRIGKVLGTRSTLTVSKWYLYAYSMLKNRVAFTGILLPFGKSIENLILGENGKRDEILVFRNPMFWFCQSITSNDNG